uniref:U46-Liphistoxin-Lth1a_1 n=1 Tax=Liphistius thaleban TaxID=1905330 RepID=A0A4V2H8S3_9ARAC
MDDPGAQLLSFCFLFVLHVHGHQEDDVDDGRDDETRYRHDAVIDVSFIEVDGHRCAVLVQFIHVDYQLDHRSSQEEWEGATAAQRQKTAFTLSSRNGILAAVCSLDYSCHVILAIIFTVVRSISSIHSIDVRNVTFRCQRSNCLVYTFHICSLPRHVTINSLLARVHCPSQLQATLVS